MSKSIPQIRKYMATVPYTIDAYQTIEVAHKMMQDHNVRHLPVMEVGELRGIISDRDVKAVMAFAGADPELVKVGDVCDDSPLKVNVDTPLDEIAELLAEKKIGSALVMDNNTLVGIFTVTDALIALAEITRARYHS